MKKIFRTILVKFGYTPWIRCSIVSAWNDNKKANVMHCTRDGYKELYIEEGLTCEDALKFETDRLMKEWGHVFEYIIIDRSKLPADRKHRDRWYVNFNRKCIGVK